MWYRESKDKAFGKNWNRPLTSDIEIPMQIQVNAYPQLRNLCWNRPNDTVVDGQEALGLYERNWRFVERDKLDAKEQNLLDVLVARFGNGVFMPA